MSKRLKKELRVKEAKEKLAQETIAYNKALFIMAIKDFFVKEGSEYRAYLDGAAVIIINIRDTFAEVLDVMKENDLYYKYGSLPYAERKSKTKVSFD